MQNPKPRALRPAAALAGILAAAFLAASCGEETPTSVPFYRVGAIEGHVRVLGEGVSVEVGAQLSTNGNSYQSRITTTADSTGWYRLELPAGLYEMQVDGGQGWVMTPDRRDTIRVAPHIFLKDLSYGKAQIRVGVPEEMEGARCDLSLRALHYGSVPSVDAYAEGGEVVFDLPIVPVGSYRMDFRDRTSLIYGIPVAISGRHWFGGGNDARRRRGADIRIRVRLRSLLCDDLRYGHRKLDGAPAGRADIRVRIDESMDASVARC